MDLWVREARLFKYGSGTGTNFSKLRGDEEPLSGGGRSSGLMSFLKIGDRAAGAIKSGGTTRRAAKMVCLDLDHPDIEAFVNWKVREEIKVAAMVEGLKHLDPQQVRTAKELGLELDYDFNGEAYHTVSGQNSNNSVRIGNEFFHRLDGDANWDLMRRTDGKIAKSIPARKLWDQIAFAAWRCADPGVQFDTTINQWHTCPAGGAIRASNPCSEYMFLDNTACNLASLNLLRFYDAKTRCFDLESFEHGVHLWTMVLEISVLMAAFPSREIARLSYEYRTLGLGYANIGAMLMQAGIAYDSDEARAITGAITAIVTGRSYATSALLAAQHGPFAGFFKNRDAMLRVIRNHRRAAYGVPRDHDAAKRNELGDYETLEIAPVPIDAQKLTDHKGTGGLANAAELRSRARAAWDDALELGEKHGYRNAQVTVIAPTGTIGLLMDCDTTGVEPDFALVKFKKLSGGGYFKIANQSLRPALEALGYSAQQVRDMLTYVLGRQSLSVPMTDAPGDAGKTFADFLRAKGFAAADLERIEAVLGGAMDLGFAVNAHTLGPDAVKRLGLTGKTDMLRALGLKRKQIEHLNEVICGSGTIEGAPHLKVEHLPVFDCANKCGRKGRRFINTAGHIRMMAAAQPFISGAISKTINLPNDATVDDIKAAYRLSWELGLKANALYRDGCKLSQPLNAAADAADADVEDEEGVEAGKQEVAGEVATAAGHAANAGTDASPAPIERIVERIVHRPMRRRLPDTRRSITHKFNVAGHEGYLTVGLYDDGRPGELFLTMAKEGSTIGGVMDSLGTAISVALQYGVPVESLVNKFTHQRFEPAGMTLNPDIPFAKSLVDYIFRWMGMEFVPGYRAANAPRRGGAAAEDAGHGMEAIAPTSPAPTSAARSRVEAIVDSANGRAPGSPGSPAPASKGNGSNGHGDGARDGVAACRCIQADATDTPRRMIAGVENETVGEARRRATALRTDDAGEVAAAAPLGLAMREMQADAPACDVCGTITVRSGTCYKCLNCGNSMGCS
jgi:ribonucleoside-diphosphate reductase alpha chain